MHTFAQSLRGIIVNYWALQFNNTLINHEVRFRHITILLHSNYRDNRVALTA